MTFDPINIVLMIVSAIVSGSVIKIWFNGGGRGHKLDTCMQLQTQTINLLAKKADDIDDNTKGTHSIVKNTHERVGRMENIQACHGQDHDFHATNLQMLQQTCSDIPEKVKNLLN